MESRGTENIHFLNTSTQQRSVGDVVVPFEPIVNTPTIPPLFQGLTDREIEITNNLGIFGQTLLHKYVIQNKPDLLLDLLKRIPKEVVNYVDCNLKTALYWAAELVHTECVRHLLDFGANPDLPNFDNKTPLLKATAKSSVPIVQMLLKAGCDPNIIDSYARSPLYRAVLGVELGKVKPLLIKQMVDAGAILSPTPPDFSFFQLDKAPNYKKFSVLNKINSLETHKAELLSFFPDQTTSPSEAKVSSSSTESSTVVDCEIVEDA